MILKSSIKKKNDIDDKVTITGNTTFWAHWREILVFTKVSAGGEHSMFLTTNGTIWAWGRNYSYQLGDGTINDHNTPLQIKFKNDFPHYETKR